jgi:hypothetical protein
MVPVISFNLGAVLSGKRWYGYFRKRVLNPETEEEEEKTICIRLDLKSRMTKSEAKQALRAEITQQTNQTRLGTRVMQMLPSRPTKLL